MGMEGYATACPEFCQALKLLEVQTNKPLGKCDLSTFPSYNALGLPGSAIHLSTQRTAFLPRPLPSANLVELCRIKSLFDNDLTNKSPPCKMVADADPSPSGTKQMAGDPCGSPAIVQPQRLTSSRGNLPAGPRRSGCCPPGRCRYRSWKAHRSRPGWS